MAYVPLLIEEAEFDAAIKGLIALNFKGFNITVPYKEKILPYLHTIDEQAKKMGAVNTVLIKDGQLQGYNTDGMGFLYALEQLHKYAVKGKKLCILGAGGTAKALAVALLEAGVQQLDIVNRSDARAKQLCESLPDTNLGYYVSDDSAALDVLANADVVVNTTPMGMAPYEAVLPIHDVSWLSSKQVIVDVVYKPKETAFLTQAKAAGAVTLNGSAMLAAQAMYAFKLFTGLDADFDTMYSEIYV